MSGRLKYACFLAATAIVSAAGPTHAAVPTEFQPNYNDGYELGYPVGYESGLSAGKERGQIEGTERGTSDGYESGWSDAYQPAYDRAYAAFYPAGHRDGWQDGHNDGFDEGLNWAPFIAAVLINNPSWANGGLAGYGSSAGSLHISGTTIYGPGFQPELIDWAAHYYDLGYTDGHATGFTDGDAKGYDLTYPFAYEAAFPIGYRNGADDGDYQGAFDGGEEGYNAGWRIGYDEGWDVGFYAGLDHGLVGFTKSRAFKLPIFTPTVAFSSDLTFTTSAQPAVPEPTSLMLLLFASLGAALIRTRKR